MGLLLLWGRNKTKIKREFERERIGQEKEKKERVFSPRLWKKKKPKNSSCLGWPAIRDLYRGIGVHANIKSKDLGERIGLMIGLEFLLDILFIWLNFMKENRGN